ncbi:hypothetical protein FOZ62_008005, partial [Perkinsus olseni]
STKAIIQLRDFCNGHLKHQDLGPVALQVLDTYLDIRSTIEAKSLAPIKDPLKKHTSMYVDDVQSRGETAAQAEEVSDHACGALGDHGFERNLKKKMASWVSCDGHYLGYTWIDDYLQVNFCYDDGLIHTEGSPVRLTRRQAFRLVMSFYDPLGLGIEYSMWLRHLGRLCYQHSDQWDSTITEGYDYALIKMVKTIGNVAPQMTRVPRALDISTIHAFSDASQVASGIVVYDAQGYRVVGTGHLYSPTESRWTTPKKETIVLTDSIALVTKYLSMVRRLHYKFTTTRVVFYVDSECVIYRLRRVYNLRRLKTITHLEIRRLESAVRDMEALVDMGIYVEVKHVEGSKNPADCCTRPSIDDPPSVPTRSFVLTAMHTATPVSIGQDGYHPTEATDLSHSDSTAAGVDYVAPVPPNSSGADVRARVMVVDIENYFHSDRIRALQLADGRTRSIIETLENVTSNEVPNGLKLFFIGDDGILYFKGVTS